MWDYLEDTEECMSIDTLAVTNNLRCVGLLGRYGRMHEYRPLVSVPHQGTLIFFKIGPVPLFLP